MDHSYRVGSLFGITIRVHLVFLLLFGLLFVQAAWTEGILRGLFFAAVFLLLFGFVLLHELGHSLVAQAHGIQVFDIVLWPLGGLARLARMPDDPGSEFRIAIAGPAVNFLLALLLTPVYLSLDDPVDLGGGLFAALVEFSLMANLGMGIFNLVPAFPLDGGRIFRAVLARRLPYLRATRAAVHVGRSFSMVAGLAALSSPDHMFIVLIAAFVWLIGGQELRLAEAQQAQREWRARFDSRAATGLRLSPGARRYLTLDRVTLEAYRREVERRLRIKGSPPPPQRPPE